MAIQVPTYDFNGAQVKVNLRTVAGLRQLFRVEFITQAGSVVSMAGQKFTGRVNTSPVTEFECVGNEEGVDIVWGRMPEGRFSYEVCCGSQIVFYGDMIVQGRMLPPLEGEGDVSVNDSLVMSVPDDSEESIAFECSEVGLMTLLERQAMFYMGENKELRDEVAQLHKAVENKVVEAESDIAQMLTQANEAQTNAEQSATYASEFAEQVETTHGLVEELANQAKSDAEVASRAKVSAENTLASVGGYAQSAEQAKTKAEQAKASAEQEAYNAYSHGSAAKTSAEVAVSKAEEAKESAELAEEAKLEAEGKLDEFKEYAYDKETSDGKYAQRDTINYFNKVNTFRDKTYYEDDVTLTRKSTEFVGDNSVLNRGENDKRYGMLGGVNTWNSENKFNGSLSFSGGVSFIYGGVGDTLYIESGEAVNITGKNLYLDGGNIVHILSDAWAHNKLSVSGDTILGGLYVNTDIGSAGNGVFGGVITTSTGIHALPLGKKTALGADAYGLSVSADGGLQLFGNHFMLSDGWSDTALKVVNNAVGLTSTDEAGLSFDYANIVHFRTMPNDGDGAGVYRFECYKWTDDSHTTKELGYVDVQKNSASQLNSTSLLNLSELNDYFLRKNFGIDQYVDSFVTFLNGVGTDYLSVGNVGLIEGRVNGGVQALELGKSLTTGNPEYGLSVVDVWATGEIRSYSSSGYVKLRTVSGSTGSPYSELMSTLRLQIDAPEVYIPDLRADVLGLGVAGIVIDEYDTNIYIGSDGHLKISGRGVDLITSNTEVTFNGKTLDAIVEEKVNAILTEKGLI